MDQHVKSISILEPSLRAPRLWEVNTGGHFNHAWWWEVNTGGHFNHAWWWEVNTGGYFKDTIHIPGDSTSFLFPGDIKVHFRLASALGFFSIIGEVLCSTMGIPIKEEILNLFDKCQIFTNVI